MAQATVTWTLPTARTDGSPLTPAEIAHTELSMSADGGASFAPPIEVPANAAQQFIVDGLAGGDYMFRAVVVDSAGKRSDNADKAFVVEFAPPAAIADLTVTIV